MAEDQKAPLPTWAENEIDQHAHHVPLFFAKLRGEEEKNVLLVGILPGGEKVYLEATKQPGKARATRRELKTLKEQVNKQQARNIPQAS